MLSIADCRTVLAVVPVLLAAWDVNVYIYASRIGSAAIHETHTPLLYISNDRLHLMVKWLT